MPARPAPPRFQQAAAAGGSGAARRRCEQRLSQSCQESNFAPWQKLKTNHLLFIWRQQHLARFGHIFQFLQIICKFSIMAIHSFCHLEEPVPQNNDLKKAHLFARKSLHLGNNTDAAKRCFVKFRSLTFSGMRISEQTDYWGLPSYSSETVFFIATCCGLTSYWTIESWRHQSYMFPASNLVYLTTLHRTKGPNPATAFGQTDLDSHGA
ncbi:uncharacterized protein J5M81_000344 isoform 2-T4 [Pluvialis apricaria]